jgi:hypothetical protein
MTFVLSIANMILRKSIVLIRLLLIVICIQFAAPSALAAPFTDAGNEHGTLLPIKKAGKPLSPSSLFEKTETKEKGERFKFYAVEIEDFSISCHFRSQTFQACCTNSPIVLYGHQPSLFRLHCVFLI